MNNSDKNKRSYITPAIEKVKLDNEISLALASTENTPPVGPGGTDESTSYAPYYFDNDPFKSNIG